MKMAVVGLGYLGATHAVAMAKLGHQVIGIDTDTRKVDELRRGHVPFYEPELEDALQDVMKAKLISFVYNMEDIDDDVAIYWVCVGTPQSSNGNSTNLTYVENSISQIAKHVSRDTLIVGKSTVPVGTHKTLLRIIEDTKREDVVINLVWNPEFLREGTALQDSLYPDRIVFGVDPKDTESVEILSEAYKHVLETDTPVIVVDYPTAELVKVAANSFLAIKISFINGVASVCEATGADVQGVSQAIGLDARIGKQFLRSGIGYGGGCLPKDIRSFSHKAEELGVVELAMLLNAAEAINSRKVNEILELTQKCLKSGLKGSKVAILGASFKPNSDDLRESPAMNIAQQLYQMGASVSIHDPKAVDMVNEHYSFLNGDNDLENVVRDADIVLHLTEWKDYQLLNPKTIAKFVNNKVIIDGRNTLDSSEWVEAGWRFESIGSK